MASIGTIEIIKNTAPLLEKNGEEISKKLYELLFSKNPQLKNVFNMTHQKKGTQQRALANAVFKYAVHIDKLEMLQHTMETIAQKHVSLAIPKSAYPIVGENLLIAIKEVLGEKATPEVMQAWSEAYNDLATLFVKREEEIYTTYEKDDGGFRGMREFVIENKVKENDFITSYYLKRKNGDPVPDFIAGQYISLTIDIPNTGHKHTRNYSLSDTSDKDYLRISIKRDLGNQKGVVSNYLHDNMDKGGVLNIGMPSGNFF